MSKYPTSSIEDEFRDQSFDARRSHWPDPPEEGYAEDLLVTEGLEDEVYYDDGRHGGRLVVDGIGVVPPEWFRRWPGLKQWVVDHYAGVEDGTHMFVLDGELVSSVDRVVSLARRNLDLPDQFKQSTINKYISGAIRIISRVRARSEFTHGSGSAQAGEPKPKADLPEPAQPAGEPEPDPQPFRLHTEVSVSGEDSALGLSVYRYFDKDLSLGQLSQLFEFIEEL